MSRGEKAKDETFEVIFEPGYPAGVPHCPHGPQVKFKSIKRVANSDVPKVSFSYRCSFHRNNECTGPKTEEIKKDRKKSEKQNRIGRGGVIPAPVKHERPVSIDREWPSSFSTNKNDQTQAQYFFDQTTISVISTMLPKNANVLLIGCPTLLLPLSDDGHDVLLLDIDDRFEKCFPTDSFARFNLVNCHFFDDSGRLFTEEFCKKESLYIICDPPFGIMVDVMQRTFATLALEATKFVFLPWWNDNRLEAHGFNMLDYRVVYEKHSKMNRNNAVRIFTTGAIDEIKLPEKEYKYCSKCKKSVFNTQFHCTICESCGDRSARGVKHCDKCGKCTVAKQLHCDTCNGCKPKKHTCVGGRPLPKCFKCGKVGHKENDCSAKIIKT